MNQRNVEQLASEAIVQKPIDITMEYEKEVISYERRFPFFKKIPVKKTEKIRESFHIFPPSLGKLQILSNLYLKLGLDLDAVKADPATEIFKCCGEKSEILAEIMAVAVLKTKEDLLNSDLIEEKKQLFLWNSTAEDFSIIVGAILMQIDLGNFSNSIRLTKLFRLNEPKESKRGASRVEK